MSWRTSSCWAWWPLWPCVFLLYGNLSTLPSSLWVFALVILSSSSSVVSWLLIWPETGSPRETSLSTNITLCLSHSCLKCLLLILSDASHQPANEQLWQGEREKEREEGRGQKRAIERPVYFARLTENSVKCWVGIMLSNIDSDFLGEKQPALVNLDWLWNNLDSSQIVECQKCTSAVHSCPVEQRTNHLKWQVNLKMSAVQNVTSLLFSISVSSWQHCVLLMCADFGRIDWNCSVLSGGSSKTNYQVDGEKQRPRAQFNMQ